MNTWKLSKDFNSRPRGRLITKLMNDSKVNTSYAKLFVVILFLLQFVSSLDVNIQIIYTK